MGARREREFVAGLYKGDGWKERVREMADDQVIAIYLRKMGEPPKAPELSEESDDGPDQQPLF